MRRWVVFALLGLALGAPATASEGTAVGVPRLAIERVDNDSWIWVEFPAESGPAERHLLRVTSEPVAPGRAGTDPSGSAAFADWTEAGRRWFSVSRDGGVNWAEARDVDTSLRMRAGTVAVGAPMPSVRPALALPASGKIFLVQFRTIGLTEWRDALADAGAEILRYFPFNAHVVRMDPANVPAVASFDFVERVEPYHPEYRLEATLLDWLSTGAGGPQEMRVRASAFEWGPTGKGRIRAAALAAGARVAAEWPSGHEIELWVNRDQLRKIAAHEDILWIDRWQPAETDMDLVREDSGANWLESTYGSCGQGVRGEVLDAGVEQNHQDFDGILMHTPADVQSHGTSTYGIVFGNGNRDGDGQAQGTGQLVCGSQGIFADYDYVTDRFAHTQQLKSAPYFASFQTNSWGSSLTTAYNSYSSEMDDIIWRLDIAITQSQSNAGSRSSRPQAWAKNIISVGGINHYNTLSTTDDRWAGGASIGPAEDGRIKPDVAYWYDGIYTTTTGNSYTSGFGGTSAATPETAGVVGLIVQQWSDNVWGTNPQGSTVFERQPHAGTIKALLVNSAKQYTFTGTTSDLTRTHQGWGRPSARSARERAARSLVVDQTRPLTLNESAVYDIDVAAGTSELKVTMVYPDPPGTTSATLHRINNLDLKVTSPSGTVYWGNNGLDAGNYSTAGGSANAVDTVENVFVSSPAAGIWTVEVRAAEINQDADRSTPATDAAFALVVTGGAQANTVCGNNVREGGEQCDGTDLGGKTCQSQGACGGTLACNADCTLNTSACDFSRLPSGSSCTLNAQCCSGSCKGKAGRKTCR